VNIFKLFGEVALKGAKAVISGLKSIEKSAEEAAEEVDQLEDELDDLPRRKDVEVNVDTDRAMSNVSGLVKALLAISPAVVPALAAVSAGAMGLVSAFGAAGVAAAGFGAVTVGVLKDVFEASEELTEAQEELEQADTAKERKKALEKQEEALSGLTKEQKKAVLALQDFKKFWERFTKSFEKPVVEMFAESLKVLKDLLEKLRPAIEGAAKASNTLLKTLGQSLKTKDVQDFFNWLSRSAEPSLVAFGKVLGNVLRGVMNLMVAFDPMGQALMDWLVKSTKAFADWSAGLSKTEGFAKFIDYVNINLPALNGLFKNLFKIIGELIKLLAPIGTVALWSLAILTEKVLDTIEAIKQAFKRIDPKDIAGSFENITVAIIQALTGGIVKFLELGALVVKKIAEGMGISVPELMMIPIRIIEGIIMGLLQAIPNILQVGFQIVLGLLKGIIAALPRLIETASQIITDLINSLVTSIPQLLQAGRQLLWSLIQGIIEALPLLMEAALQIITSLAINITNMLPSILQMGFQLLMSLLNGILQALPQLILQLSMLVTTIINTLTQFVINNLPQLLQAGLALLQGILQGITSNLPMILATILVLIQNILDAILQNLDKLINAGIEILMALIDGITRMLPSLVEMAIYLIDKVAVMLLENLPKIIDAGVKILLALVDGISKMMPQLVPAAVKLILKLFDALIQNLPKIIDAGIKILLSLIDGLIKTIPTLIIAIPKIIKAIIDAFADVDWLQVGKDIIKGIAKGLASAASSLWEAAKDVARRALAKAKEALGISSPSKVFAKEVGRWIPPGIVEGIASQEDLVEDAIESMLPTPEIEPDFALTSNRTGLGVAGVSGSGQTTINLTINYGNVSLNSRADMRANAEIIGEQLRRLFDRQDRTVRGGVL